MFQNKLFRRIRVNGIVAVIISALFLGTACSGTSGTEGVTGDYEWNPYVWSESLTKAYGETAKEATFNCIKAMMNGETSFDCPNEQDIPNIQSIAYIVCPYFFKITEGSVLPGNGKGIIEYTCSKEEAKKIIDDFAVSVKSVLDASIAKGDTDEIKAIMLHYNFSKTLDYDMVALEKDDVDITPYRAVVERKGICQSFAMALAHIYLQVGLDCNLAMGSSDMGPHMWVYMELNGEKIYIEPTWEDTHKGTGLSFFGIDTAFYISNGYTVFSDLFMPDSSYNGNISTEKYKPLWEMKEITGIERKSRKLVISYIDASGKAATFEVKK